ncbi:unnamed protein product [Rotaria magnacalcarata]|uniref:Uncharacterized protein n=1 Tax=Rotaria magnacalcarata TaxID=392030 RepID=A0A816Q4V4_9BILA|nr:unnamed protein product [Rotaria magnacalcarata]CAF2168670.1 unnamed protein product [Rotaria magnacalcarata]CAF4026971.1 unnamed protein product [Rotaria magnacalcarata]CAF4317237.1 unnamed protein product [Rotaria magnacalcarata]
MDTMRLKSSGYGLKILVIIIVAIIAGGGAVATAVMAVNMNTTIKSTTTTSETTTTTTTSITTTNSETTTATAGVVVTGTLIYAVKLIGNGYHGVTKVRYCSATNMGSSMRYDYPIAYLSGTTFQEVMLIILGTAFTPVVETYVGITASCGTGCIGSFTTYVSPDSAVYTSSGTTSTAYGAASSCGNPMIYCDCTL